MNDVPSVTDLVTRAMHGDEQAWDALVERYAPLVWSICRRYRLSDADAHDVSQSVWLGLVNHLGKLRDPGALPGWLATTTRRECGKVRHEAQTAGNVLDTSNIPDEQARMAQQELLVAERHAALREAVTRLSPNCQRLIAILIEDPPVPYAQISARLGIPVGSIGPCRGRCLDKLRRNPAIAALIDADTDPAAGHDDTDIEDVRCGDRPSPPLAAGQGSRQVGHLPDDRVLRRTDRQPPRSSAQPQSQ